MLFASQVGHCFIVAPEISMSAWDFDETPRESNLILDGHEIRRTF